MAGEIIPFPSNNNRLPGSNSESTGDPQLMNSPQSDWGLQYAKILAALADAQYQWANGEYARGMDITNQNIAKFSDLSNSGAGFAKHLISQYQDVFEPMMASYNAQAQSYAGEGRQRFNAGQAESDVGQAYDAQINEAERKLEGQGINVNSGRSQDMIMSAKLSRAAAAAGAGTKAMRDTEDRGRAMTERMMAMGQNVPGMAVNSANLALGATTAGQNALLGQQNTGAAMFGNAAKFASAASEANKLPPVGNVTRSQSQSVPQPVGGSSGGSKSNYLDPLDSGGKGAKPQSEKSQGGGKGGNGPAPDDGTPPITYGDGRGGGDDDDGTGEKVSGPGGNPDDWGPSFISPENPDLPTSENAPWPAQTPTESVIPEGPSFDPGTTRQAEPYAPQGEVNNYTNNNTQTSENSWNNTQEDNTMPQNANYTQGSQDFYNSGNQSNDYYSNDQNNDYYNNNDQPSEENNYYNNGDQVSKDNYNNYGGGGDDYYGDEGGNDNYDSGGGNDYGGGDDYSGGDGGDNYGSGYDTGDNYGDNDYGGGSDYEGYAGGGRVQPSTGGQVPRSASPSQGRRTDDIPARLNAGEFVIPRDVVAIKGTEFFRSLIEKSRRARTGMSGPPPKPKMKPALRLRPSFVSRGM